MANISTIKVGDTSYGIIATPTAHASTATTYGAATASNYGHVKLSDNYTSSAGAAASGIGASSLAVYNAYNTLNSNLDGMFKYVSGTKEINIPQGVFAVTISLEVPSGYTAIALRNYNINNRYNVSITAVYINGAYVTILGENNRPEFDTNVYTQCVAVKSNMLSS